MDVTTNTKRIAIFILLLVLAIACLTGVMLWIYASPYSATSDPSGDFWERALDTAIMVNATDFARWYKLNIVMQILAILCGIGATVVASLTNTVNANFMKYITITLTTVTSIMLAVQSAFHIRENLSAYIQVNSDLVKLQHEYLVDRSEMQKSGKSREQIELDTATKYNSIQEIRWRSYAIIGHQQQKPEVPPPAAPNPSGAKPSQ